MKKTIFQVFIDIKKKKKPIHKEPCILLSLVARDSRLFCMVRGWYLLLSLGLFLTARVNRASLCSPKKQQSCFSFDKSKVPKSFR